jgi:hypothetical protein
LDYVERSNGEPLYIYIYIYFFFFILIFSEREKTADLLVSTVLILFFHIDV